MQEKAWKTINKSQWPRGLWDAENDKAQWLDHESGLPCLMVRNPRGGHWCGYVGVPKGHPWHGLDYTASPELDAVEVHGGLTFASRCQHPEDEATGVCHVVEDGDDDDVWWLGFDCAHYGDCSPGYQMFDGSYKTAEYIRFECANLARQVIEADA
jgi:hypothetical protein